LYRNWLFHLSYDSLGQSSGAFVIDSIQPCLQSRLIFAPTLNLLYLQENWEMLLMAQQLLNLNLSSRYLAHEDTVHGKGTDVEWPFSLNLSDIGTIDTLFTVKVFHKSRELEKVCLLDLTN